MTNQTTSFLLVLFGVPFLGAGLALGVSICRTVALAKAMGSWVEVPAIIESTHLETSSDEDGTAYRVTATYTYLFNRRTYTGDRVGISGGYDNVGSYNRTMYARLYRAKIQKETATCFVDPNHPEKAVLDRRLRGSMVAFISLVALAFAGSGLAVIFVAIAR